MRGLRYAATVLLVTAAATAGCAAQDRSDEAGSPAPSVRPAPPMTSGPGRPDRHRQRAERHNGTRASAAPATPSYSISIPDLPTPHDRGIVEGGDASWPQCPKGMGIPQKRSEGKPMPLDTAEFVLLGLTNGPGFHANPCLASQVAWVKERHLMAAAYSILSYPVGKDLATYGGSGPFDASTREGRLSNVGYREARFNLASMHAAGLSSPIVWLDVEPVAGFDWSDDVRANAAVVQGATRGYTDAGLRVGIYSLASMWERVVGDLRLGLPEWRPAGGTSRAEALRRCGADWMFQGGTAALAQWVEDDRDRDVTCPGTSTYLSLWFHAY